MSMSQHEEYVTPSGQTITIQRNDTCKVWEVACWDENDTNQWYLEFPDEEEARVEFNRWRS